MHGDQGTEHHYRKEEAGPIENSKAKQRHNQRKRQRRNYHSIYFLNPHGGAYLKHAHSADRSQRDIKKHGQIAVEYQYQNHISDPEYRRHQSFRHLNPSKPPIAPSVFR